MTFFGVWPRQGFAGYWPVEFDGSIPESQFPEEARRVEARVVEYLGDPPRKPGRRGSFHKSAYAYFIRDDVLDQFKNAARGRLFSKQTTVVGREGERFHQIWVTNVVDCLDIPNSLISPESGKQMGKIGFIKRPAFNENQWDGSDLFVLPQDPNYVLYCSEDFIAEWKENKKSGIEFRRHVMDLDPICC